MVSKVCDFTKCKGSELSLFLSCLYAHVQIRSQFEKKDAKQRGRTEVLLQYHRLCAGLDDSLNTSPAPLFSVQH